VKHPDLFSRFLNENQMLYLTGRNQPFIHLINPSGHPPLKITKFQEYLEAGLSGSMRNFNVIHSVLSASGLSILPKLFTLETRSLEGEGLSHTEGGKAAGYLKFGIQFEKEVTRIIIAK
jgi:hypothetical protein